MRIQHNIMAMSAYRNYTNNVSAMKKNLEKLSSGYKINRAGDDAAGLAISEKMRAQITGLETAQKNAKDGISLVQTAEGALTEVHDMLNRMVELATMSANGTYDNTTDRAQLQKEMDQLNSEIDRIADSANFNGIKLLDGSMDANAVKGASAAVPGAITALPIAAVKAPGSATLGADTILHTGGGSDTMTKFGVALHEVSFSNNTGESVKIAIGGTGNFIEVKAGANNKTAGTAMTAKDIVDAIKAKSNDATGNEVAFGGNISAGSTAGEIVIDGETFTLGTADGGTTLTFTQKDITNKAINGDMSVNVDIANAAAAVTPGDAPSTAVTSAAVDVTTPGAAAATAVYTYDFAGLNGLSAGSYDVTIAGQTVTVALTSGATTAADLVTAVKAALTAPEDGLTAATASSSASKYTIGGTGTEITFTASAKGSIGASHAISGNITVAPAAAREAGGVKGDYNVKTTQTVTGEAAAGKRIASTKVTMTKEMFAEGNTFKIGGKDYTVGKGSSFSVDITDLDLTKSADLQKAIDKLSVAVAKDNEVWTMGQASGADVTFVEKVGADGKSYMEAKGSNAEFDLTLEDGVKAALGLQAKGTAAVAGTPGKSLTLQIGDTADKYNQLTVNIKDMHANAIGKDYQKEADGSYKKDANGDLIIDQTTKSLRDINIAEQTDAQEAVDVIKRAINQVSDLRGTLGATQNRLDHTINNLSVMTENIQDAESTIRDVDVAEEMMAYTKNNILIQSAQAMLAQANQVPQGVLQLLQ